MGLFKKKKVIVEEPPGFPELKKKIPAIEEIEEREEHEELPEIPGLEEKEEKPKHKSFIPELKKELPEKIAVDIGHVNENPAQIYKKHKALREEISHKHAVEQKQMPKEARDKDEDKSIFVKIEDFNSVTFSLNEIKNKLKLIEGDISQLKALKAREDSEIVSWEQEVMSIKEKLVTIDKILSSKTEK